jgi:protein-tyrosine-phosphatase/DNA-binding transcriptional ArsR family regulator
VSAPAADHALPPPFVTLAAHPIRWRVLSALAREDLRVREMCARLGLGQSHVSYHLGRLRQQGVVSARRSSADGRDAYYTLDLARCGELLAQSASALHPGLAPPATLEPVSPPLPLRLLFLCTGNSARSQIAEALAQRLAPAAVVHSAGSHPKPLHPNAVRVMSARGIDISGRRSKPLEEFLADQFDCVITLCDRVREVCPEFPDHPQRLHWSVPDPAREGATDEESYPAFERTADEIAARIPFLLALIDHTATVREEKRA